MQLFGSRNYGDPPQFGGGVRMSPRPISRPMPTTAPGGGVKLGARPILGYMKKGSKRIKKTGAYVLHKDEAVLDKNKADTMRAKVRATMKKKKAGY